MMWDVVEDHPRSRGVYDWDIISMYSQRRIIPARAGFTSMIGLLGSALRDHPRSRGVYLGVLLVAVHDMGSSPLARGLLSVYVRRV